MRRIIKIDRTKYLASMGIQESQGPFPYFNSIHLFLNDHEYVTEEIMNCIYFGTKTIASKKEVKLYNLYKRLNNL